MAIWEATRAAAPFAALGLAVPLAVYGWMRVGETRRDKYTRPPAKRGWFAFALLPTAATPSVWSVFGARAPGW